MGFVEDALVALEQAGGDVTADYNGELDAGGRTPLVEPYFKKGLCPVNVHWHLGSEHYSMGEYDENGSGPEGHTVAADDSENDRRLADVARLGFRCSHYDKMDAKFTKEYVWQ